jgi:hypothetical protein
MCFHVFSLSLSQRVVCGCWPTLSRCRPTLAHTLTLSLSLSVSLLPCLSLFHLKGAATPKSGSIGIQISLYSVLIISKVAPTRNIIFLSQSFVIVFESYLCKIKNRWKDSNSNLSYQPIKLTAINLIIF